MYLEALTVSVHFTDYLERCLPNAKHFDRWLIVTTEEDKKTIDLCKKYNLEYAFCNRLYDNGASFARGRGINDGLKHLSQQDWILLLDSDILLPDTFREDIESLHPSPQNIYGMQERTVVICEKDLENNNDREYKDTVLLNQKLCSGFFQLYNVQSNNLYPEKSNDSSGDDLAFCKQWPIEQRVLLDMPCRHLGLPILNWGERKVDSFNKKPTLQHMLVWKVRFVWSQWIGQFYMNHPRLYAAKNRLMMKLVSLQRTLTTNGKKKERLTKKIETIAKRSLTN